MGGVQGLHHVGDGVALGGHAEALDGVGDGGRLVTQRLEQAQHAVGAGGRSDQHRADDAVAQLLGEIVEYLVARRRNVLEQLLHQLVVVVGQLFQHAEARFALAFEMLVERHDLRGSVLLVDERAFQREIDEAGDDVVRPDRNLAQHQRHARRRLQDLQGLANALVGLVDLVQEQEAGDA